jgi:hypothetical protein
MCSPLMHLLASEIARPDVRYLVGCQRIAIGQITATEPIWQAAGLASPPAPAGAPRAKGPGEHAVHVEHLDAGAGPRVDGIERLKGGPPLGVGDHCPCGRGLGQGQAAQVVGGGLRLAACCEKSAAVGLQETDPGLDVAGVAQVTVNRELGAEERRAQLGDQFLCGIGALAKAVPQVTIQARLVACRVARTGSGTC